MKIHVDEDKPVVQEGRYKVRFIKHEAGIPGQGPGSSGTRLTFQVLSKEFKGETVNCIIWMKKDDDNEYHILEREPGYKLLLGLNKGKEISDIKFKPLYDEVYWVEVIHKQNKDGDRTFANVTEIEPYEKEEEKEEKPEKTEKKKSSDDDDKDTEDKDFKDDDKGKDKDKSSKKKGKEEEIDDKELDDGDDE